MFSRLLEEKYLIINADDFGLSTGINRGIIFAVKKGIVTSISVILRKETLNDVRRLINQNPHFDWGLHVKLENTNKLTEKSIIEATNNQLATFRSYFQINPTHLDYHKGFKFTKRTYFAVRMFVKKQKLAFRYDNLHHIETRFFGMFGENTRIEKVSAQSLIECFNDIKPGITELICHPGWTSSRLDDPYRLQRNKEVETLTNSSIRDEIKKRNITLISFYEYGKYVNRF